MENGPKEEVSTSSLAGETKQLSPFEEQEGVYTDIFSIASFVAQLDSQLKREDLITQGFHLPIFLTTTWQQF